MLFFLLYMTKLKKLKNRILSLLFTMQQHYQQPKLILIYYFHECITKTLNHKGACHSTGELNRYYLCKTVLTDTSFACAKRSRQSLCLPKNSFDTARNILVRPYQVY